MTRCFPLSIAALVLLTLPAAAQTGPGEEPPRPPPYPYAQIVPLPANGCIWANQIYSNGAVIGGTPPTRSFFRCVQGSWRSFPSAAEAVENAPPNTAASAPR